MVSSIYRATNTFTNKVYIGFAMDFVARIRRHKILYKTTNTKFYNAIKKYGWDAFKWDILYQSRDQQHCHQVMESLFIQEYDSIENGYNTTEGGRGVIGAARNRIWINDGTNHKRVPEDCIPEGWAIGRVGLQRKFNTQWTPNRKPRRSYAGGNNPAAKSVSIHGIRYDTMKDAVNNLKLSEPTIRRRCKSSSSEYTDWFYVF